MKQFKVSIQIGFYSQPYACYTVWAYDKKDAASRVDSALPKHMGHRFLNAEEIGVSPAVQTEKG